MTIKKKFACFASIIIGVFCYDAEAARNKPFPSPGLRRGIACQNVLVVRSPVGREQVIDMGLLENLANYDLRQSQLKTMHFATAPLKGAFRVETDDVAIIARVSESLGLVAELLATKGQLLKIVPYSPESKPSAISAPGLKEVSSYLSVESVASLYYALMKRRMEFSFSQVAADGRIDPNLKFEVGFELIMRLRDSLIVKTSSRPQGQVLELTNSQMDEIVSYALEAVVASDSTSLTSR